MGFEPVNSNTLNKTCPDPTGSNCVTWQGPDLPCLNICKGISITEVLYQTALLACTANSNVGDLTNIDLGCLYQDTIQTWTCPVGQVFLTSSAAPALNGTPGFCNIPATATSPAVGTRDVPVLTTRANPSPRPTTLAAILELMISKIPCCDPCSGPNNTGG